MDRKARRTIRRKSRRRSRRNAPDELQSVPSTPTLDTVQSDRDNVQQLQGMIGNQAVSRMIQRTPIDGTIQRSIKDLINFWENVGGGGNDRNNAPANNDAPESQQEAPEQASGGGGLYSYMTQILGNGISYNAFGDLLDSDDGGGGGMDAETIAYLLSEMESDETDSDSGGTDNNLYTTMAQMLGNGNQYTTMADFDADYDDPFGWLDDDSDDDYDDDDDDGYEFGLTSSATVDNKEDTKYSEKKEMLGGHEHESDDSTDFTLMLLKDALQIVIRNPAAVAQFEQHGAIDMSGKRISWLTVCHAHMGWSPDVTRQYLGDQLDNNGMGPFDIKLNQKTNVEYLDEDDRKNYQLHLGSAIKQGNPAHTFDTGDMYSKFKGAGFGIYVMSMNGEMYSNAHQVGLFHHSSFLSGGDVAGAGELKVDNGTLKYITNKSGHYWPGKEQLVQTLMELKDNGVSLSGVKVFMLPEQKEYQGDAAKFLDEYGYLVQKPSNESNFDWEDDSDDDDDDFDFDIDPDESKYLYLMGEDGYIERIKREDAPEDDDDDDEITMVMTSGGYLAPFDPDSETIFYVNDEGRVEPVDEIDSQIPLSRYVTMLPNGYFVSIGSSDNDLTPDEDESRYSTPIEIGNYYVITNEGYLESAP